MNAISRTAILLALAWVPLLSQEKAVTDSGKTIWIYPNGTWKESKAPASVSIANDMVRPKLSTAKASILKGRASIYYNPAKWKPKGVEEGGRSNFTHIDGDAQAIIITERIQMPLENLEKVALENAKSAAPDAVIALKETRRVNGTNVTVLQIRGTIEGTSFVYYGYYYSFDKGVIQVITFTSKNLFNEYKTDFDDFLNGLTIEP